MMLSDEVAQINSSRIESHKSARVIYQFKTRSSGFYLRKRVTPCSTELDGSPCSSLVEQLDRAGCHRAPSFVKLALRQLLALYLRLLDHILQLVAHCKLLRQ